MIRWLTVFLGSLTITVGIFMLIGGEAEREEIYDKIYTSCEVSNSADLKKGREIVCVTDAQYKAYLKYLNSLPESREYI